MLAAFFDIKPAQSEKQPSTFKRMPKTKPSAPKKTKVKPSEAKSTHMHVEFVPLPPEKGIPKAANEFDVVPGALADAPEEPPWWFEEADQQHATAADDDTDSCTTFEESDDVSTPTSRSSRSLQDEAPADTAVLRRRPKDTHIVYSGPLLCFEDDENIF